jgi:hypothetical protein
MNLSDFKGHRVRITFFQATDVNGFQVRRMEGVFGGPSGMTFTLSDITAAVDVDGNDVATAAKLLHGAIVGDVDNIAILESPTPVH